MTTDSAWSRIEEGSIALQDAGSESQTRLHDGVQANDGQAALQVTRTMDLSVANDSHSGSSGR
jgi:hypothetical protein